MAYAFTSTVTHLGGRDWQVVIDETDAGAATEATITGLPSKALLMAQIASLLGGAGTTVDPVLGIATNPAALAITSIVENDTAAAQISNLALPPVPFSATTLFHRSVVDSGSDNIVKTIYLLKAGW